MKTTVLVLGTLFILCLSPFIIHGEESEGKESDVISLNDDNFEHLTQATSGSTTGNWFVNFYAPGCFHCIKLDPIWDKVATELKGDNPVAKVDVTVNAKTKKRLPIHGTPTLFLLKGGKGYLYEGEREVAKLVAFARDGYKRAKSFDILPQLSFFEETWAMIKDDLLSLYQFKKAALGVVFGVGLVLGFVIRGLFIGGQRLKKD